MLKLVLESNNNFYAIYVQYFCYVCYQCYHGKCVGFSATQVNKLKTNKVVFLCNLHSETGTFLVIDKKKKQILRLWNIEHFLWWIVDCSASAILFKMTTNTCPFGCVPFSLPRGRFCLQFTSYKNL